MTISEKTLKSKKKIIIIEDSALMRRVMCDIINSDERFQVVDQAVDGEEGLKYLKQNQYDGVVLDINMPKMDGLELLRVLKKEKIRERVMVASTDAHEGAAVTLECLELGALDFVEKPANIVHLKGDQFKERFLDILYAVTTSSQSNLPRESSQRTTVSTSQKQSSPGRTQTTPSARPQTGGSKIVALACSTGGPKALQSVIPNIPANIAAPIVIVQHMPQGFTASLAERLNQMSKVFVKEAAEGDVLENGKVYIARGGAHLNIVTKGSQASIHYTDEPPREGVKPCANYMYESLKNSNYSQVVCVVLTGMGADGTKGIVNLETSKKIHVIAQDEASCTVYGMPKSIAATGLVNQVVSLDDVAQEIISNVGVK